MLAEHFIRLLEEHSRCIVERVDLQRFIKTCGRFDNLCRRCRKSSRFFCDHNIVDLGQDRSRVLAKAGMLVEHSPPRRTLQLSEDSSDARHTRVDSKQNNDDSALAGKGVVHALNDPAEINSRVLYSWVGKRSTPADGNPRDESC